MPANCRPKSVKTETQMSQAVACFLKKYAAREVRVGDCIFDVVAYNKNEKLFKLVECKKSRKSSGIGHAFGQLAAYSTTIAAHATDFLDAYSRKLPVRMRYLRWVEATDNFSRIKVAFHVALTEEACKRVELLRALKKLLPDVGIFRVKPDGYVRDYVRVRMNKDYKLAKARPVVIKLLRP